MKNFKFFINGNSTSNTALLGKTGFLRLNKRIIENLQINRSDKWVLALDNDEEEKKNIYVLKDSFSDGFKGKKMIVINDNWSLDCNKILNDINVKLPVKCRLEKYDEKEFSGFRIII